MVSRTHMCQGVAGEWRTKNLGGFKEPGNKNNWRFQKSSVHFPCTFRALCVCKVKWSESGRKVVGKCSESARKVLGSARTASGKANAHAYVHTRARCFRHARSSVCTRASTYACYFHLSAHVHVHAHILLVFTLQVCMCRSVSWSRADNSVVSRLI